MKPSEIKEKIESKKLSIETFLSCFPTGSYGTAIKSNKFILEMNVDDNYGTITINIKFSRNEITNKDSLLEYSQTFSGFSHF